MQSHPVVLLLFFIFTGAGAGVYVGFSNPIPAAGFVAMGFFCLVAIRVAKQWQKAVILRLGKYHSVRGPGIFIVLPFLDMVAQWTDIRIKSTPFDAEQTLTKDSVPVYVDAVLFWKIVDPKKATLEVETYEESIFWSAQTALRDVIGMTDISDMLVGRENIDQAVRRLIRERTEPWGIDAIGVEIRDVKIPESLQNVMSLQAQAERERLARVILADSERRIAETFCDSAKLYNNNPIAFKLRSMNVLLEGMRQGSTMIIVPSTAVETMGLGTTTGLASLAQDSLNIKSKQSTQGAELQSDSHSKLSSD